MNFSALLVSFCFIGVASGCAATPGSDDGAPTNEKTISITFYPPISWTARDATIRRKRAVTEPTTASTSTTTVATTTIGSAENPPTSITTSAAPASATDSPSAPGGTNNGNGNPSESQQPSVGKAQKMMTKAIKNSLLAAITKNGFAVTPEISFPEMPNLQMTLDPADVRDNTVMKSVTVGVLAKLPYPVAGSIWRTITNTVLADLTNENKLLIESIEMDS